MLILPVMDARYKMNFAIQFYSFAFRASYHYYNISTENLETLIIVRLGKYRYRTGEGFKKLYA